jgi:hypothetical protein
MGTIYAQSKEKTMEAENTASLEMIHPELHELIRDIINKGLEVYVPVRPSLIASTYTYFYLTDGVRIGYAQVVNNHGIGFRTVYIPSRLDGIGAQVSDGWVYHKGLVDEALKSLNLVPEWWYKESSHTPKGYRDFNHFAKNRKAQLRKVVL